MTLGLLYGLVPLSEAFEQWRKGLLKILPKGRQTFRGFNTHSDSTSYSYEELIHNWKIDIFVTETIESNVRAGVLADIDPPSVSVLALLEPRAIVSTAYVLSRLSFVVDWFINVGNWLCSWSPTVGTNILSSWVVIETEQKITARNKWLPVLNDWEKSQSVSGNGTATVSLKRKLRIPVSPSNRPYPHLLMLTLTSIRFLHSSFSSEKLRSNIKWSITMQNNDITLGTVHYERFKEYPDRTVYNADDHSILSPHILALSRVELKTVDQFVKSRVKFSRRITNADGTKTGDIIVTADFSYPQWASEAAVTAQLTQLGLFTASPEAAELVLKQSV